MAGRSSLCVTISREAILVTTLEMSTQYPGLKVSVVAKNTLMKLMNASVKGWMPLLHTA